MRDLLDRSQKLCLVFGIALLTVGSVFFIDIHPELGRLLLFTGIGVYATSFVLTATKIKLYDKTT